MSDAAISDVDAVRSALRSIAGVRSADLDADGVLTLDLADDADEIEVATAVGRMLHDEFGLGVDPAQVQMVEAINPDAAAREFDAGERHPVEVRSMNVTSAGRKVNVSVVLGRGERECAGDAVGTTSAYGLQRAVAAATLHAIEELTEDAVIGRLERLDVGADAVVELVLDIDGIEVAAAGTSPVQADPRQAIVRAIVHATAAHLP